MEKIHLLWIVPLALAIGIVLGYFILSNSLEEDLQNYDLWWCIYQEAYIQDFPQDYYSVNLIEQSCISYVYPMEELVVQEQTVEDSNYRLGFSGKEPPVPDFDIPQWGE